MTEVIRSSDDARRLTRRLFLGRGLAAAGVVAFAPALAGCGGGSGGGDAGGPFRLRIATTRPLSTVPGMNYDPASDLHAKLVASGLFAADSSFEPVPADSADYEHDATFTRHVFTLRPDLRWSDGSAVTAADYVGAVHRRIKEGVLLTPNFIEGFVDVIIGGADVAKFGFRELDATTIEMRTASSVPFLPSFLAADIDYTPLPPAAREAESLDDLTGPGALAGNGPYRMVEQTEEGARYTRNEHYSGPPAGPDEIEVSYFTAIDNTAYTAFLGDQLDVVDVTAANVVAARNDPDTSERLTELTWSNLFTIILNHATAPLGDVRVRQALYLAIDREALVDSVWHGAAEPAYGYLMPGQPGYDAEARPLGEFAPGAARELLAAAGFAGGEGFPEFTVITDGSPDGTQMLEAVQSMWAEHLGVRVKLRKLDYNTYFGQVITGHQVRWGDMAIGWWPCFFPDPQDFVDGALTAPGLVFRHNWQQSAEQQARQAAAIYEVDAAERERLLRALDDEFAKAVPVIPVASPRTVQVRGSDVDGRYAPYGLWVYGVRNFSRA